MGLWKDHEANIFWLDSTYPVDSTSPGSARGTCPTTSGIPKDVDSAQADSKVTLSDISYGPIGSAIDGPWPTPSPTLSPSPTPSHCPGGFMNACIDLCPPDVFTACVDENATRLVCDLPGCTGLPWGSSDSLHGDPSSLPFHCMPSTP